MSLAVDSDRVADTLVPSTNIDRQTIHSPA